MFKCLKVFILFPPTEKNLYAFNQDYNDRTEILGRLCRVLEGGVFHFLDSSSGIRLPPGCLHAVLTIIPGFLVSQSYMDSQTIAGLSMLCAHLSTWVSEDQGRMIDTWSDAAEISLRNSKNWALTYACWQMIREILKHGIGSSEKRRSRVAKILEHLSERAMSANDATAVEDVGKFLNEVTPNRAQRKRGQ